MRFIKTLPNTGEQKGFYSTYAKFALAISTGVLLSQLISSFTEAAILYNTVFDSLSIFGRYSAKIGAFIGTCIGLGLIELVGLRVFLPLAIDAILYKRFKGLHLAMSSFIIIMTLALISGSLYLSIEGKTDTINNVFEEQEQHEESRITAFALNNEIIEYSKYKSDSTEIRNRYTAQIAATNNQFSAKKSKAESELRTWASKRGNYQTRINKALTKIEGIKAEQAGNIAALELEQANELLEAKESYKAESNKLKSTLAATLSDNTTEAATKKSRYGKGGFWLILLAQFFAITGITLDRIFKKGSGIAEAPVATDYDFRSSAWSEWVEAAKERINVNLRNRIVAFENDTPVAELSQRVNTVYDRSELKEFVIKLEVEQLNDSARTIQIAAPQMPTRKIGFHQESKAVSKINDLEESLKIFDWDGFEAKMKGYYKLMSLEEYINLSGNAMKMYDEYQQLHFRKYGTATKDDSGKRNATVTDTPKVSLETAIRLCDECSTSIAHKRSDARFCGTSCRKKWHSKKHGGNEFDEYHRIK